MLWKEWGEADRPAVVLLHGGGLSDWSWREAAEQLLPDFRVVTPVIDGHGADGAHDFVSIERAAQQVTDAIDRRCGGTVFAICGLSIGAQIAAEVLSQRDSIAQYAVLESALVCPMKAAVAAAPALYRMSYGLIRRRWFASWQAKALFVPPELFECYYQDSQKISRQSLCNIARSNGSYRMKPSLAQTKASVLILAGTKEIRAIRRSAQLLQEQIPGSRLCWAQGMKHGELSLRYPAEYVRLLRLFFAEQDPWTLGAVMLSET